MLGLGACQFLLLAWRCTSTKAGNINMGLQGRLELLKRVYSISSVGQIEYIRLREDQLGDIRGVKGADIPNKSIN
jgi:hypothetical protein